MATLTPENLQPSAETVALMTKTIAANYDQARLMAAIGAAPERIMAAGMLSGVICAVTHPEWAALFFRVLANSGVEQEAELVNDARKLISAIAIDGWNIPTEVEE